MVNLLLFISGFIFCALPAWLMLREQRRAYETLQNDSRQLINEFSIRTKGRKVFREDRKVEQGATDTPQDVERYSILLPSMAEEEAEGRDEGNNTAGLSDADMEHLRSRGVIQ